ncbi:FoF1 ATP synthase subunit delta/epsilon [Methylomonas rapida]|uniref:ATP synthase epsilon chain n=1 Tax=Methylomonas rapida TaxID=2963939 RepID=A0ABY7GKI2_9GAMM|nr:F0F1 ATP synthase subunit epsilon [Methylomonas rapida]WAR45005.1 F0F1 ATP synthase subunit epsilon [Methylomonas rapida]
MNRFTLTLQHCQGLEHFAEVVQFIGADAQGSFGILAGHVHCIALLRYGLARFCDRDGVWHYLALPGGVLRFADNRLTVTAVRYFLGDNAGLLCEQLAAEMARTDSEIHSARATLSEIERSLVRRLAELGGHGPGGMST